MKRDSLAPTFVVPAANKQSLPLSSSSFFSSLRCSSSSISVLLRCSFSSLWPVPYSASSRPSLSPLAADEPTLILCSRIHYFLRCCGCRKACFSVSLFCSTRFSPFCSLWPLALYLILSCLSFASPPQSRLSCSPSSCRSSILYFIYACIYTLALGFCAAKCAHKYARKILSRCGRCCCCFHF